MPWVWLPPLLAALLQGPPEPQGDATFQTFFAGEIAGRASSFELGVGGRLDLERDLGIEPTFAFDLQTRWSRDQERFIFVDLFALSFRGARTVTTDVVYGGQVYSAGSVIRSQGLWVGADIGWAQAFPVESIAEFTAGFSLSFHSLELEQTRVHLSFLSTLLGARVGAWLRPWPILRVGIDAGAGLGGKDWWAVPLLLVSGGSASYRGGSVWSANVSAWISIDPDPLVSLGFGYAMRFFSTSSYDDVAELNENNIDLRFQGPMLTVQVRF